MAWVALFFAGLFEIGWAVGLKHSEGFSKFWPSLWTGAAMLVSILLLGYALKSLPLGTAYTVWTGIGTVGTAALGMILFGEPAGAARLLCVAAIAGGIVGLKLLPG